jgi:hypothetical protein
VLQRIRVYFRQNATVSPMQYLNHSTAHTTVGMCFHPVGCLHLPDRGCNLGRAGPEPSFLLARRLELRAHKRLSVNSPGGAGLPRSKPGVPAP